MDTERQITEGRKLLRDGWADEDVERLTGLSLAGIILLRSEAAAASALKVRLGAKTPASPSRRPD